VWELSGAATPPPAGVELRLRGARSLHFYGIANLFASTCEALKKQDHMAISTV
jgi:hypothetical protein